MHSEEAEQRLIHSGSQITATRFKTNEIELLLSQFKSPVILLLIFAATLSFFLSDAADTIILIIVFVSSLLGFWQERGAANAVQKLLATVQIEAKVMRDGERLSDYESSLRSIAPRGIVLMRDS